jgi:L-asparaginase / beta-aspartyl-peptidase
MRSIYWLPIVGFMLTSMAAADEQPTPKVIFAVHGGAGVIARDKLTGEVERDVRENLDKALDAGHAVLKRGGTSLDAVEAAIRLMEDAPVFNAGRGAAFTRDRTIELDASIMDGKTRAAGAVAVVSRIKNPIAAARAVMEKSPHVLLTGTGAEKFAEEIGLKMETPEYFKTPSRLKALEDKLRGESKRTGTDKGGADSQTQLNKNESSNIDKRQEDHLYGTVGAVALDAAGNLAAGTSTGGITGKRSGRIGDSPILGAGTYADNKICAISATGDGEYFIRTSCARTIAALIEYKLMTLEEASRTVLFDQIKPLGGNGGVIVLGPKGDVAFTFTTQGMYRGYITEDGKKKVLIYNDE